jgi:hypothetical protein
MLNAEVARLPVVVITRAVRAWLSVLLAVFTCAFPAWGGVKLALEVVLPTILAGIVKGILDERALDLKILACDTCAVSVRCVMQVCFLGVDFVVHPDGFDSLNRSVSRLPASAKVIVEGGR